MSEKRKVGRPKLFRPLHKAIEFNRTVLDGTSEWKKLYDENWKKYRLVFLHHNPKCYACGKKSEVVDHLIPHKGNIDMFWKVDNFLPLCKKHHDEVTNRFDKKFQGNISLKKKVEYLQGFRLMFGVESKVKVVPFSESLILHIAKLKQLVK